MERNSIGSVWDRTNRNGINENFQYLFSEVSSVQNMKVDLSRVQREVNTLTNLNKRTEEILNESQRINGMNEDVQNQLDNLIIESGNANAEVSQARGGHDLLRGRFEDIEDKRADYNFTSNNSQPAKKGLLTNSYKLARKIDADNLEVFQKTSKGYLRYLFRQNSGGTGYGVDYELLRVIRVEPISDVVVFSHAGNPTDGTVEPTFPQFSVDPNNPFNNTTTRNFFDGYNADNSNNYHSEDALQPYTIASNSSVTYRIDKPTNTKLNVAFFHRSGRSGNNDVVNIYVNNRLARTVTINDSFSQNLMRFDIPVYERSTNANNPLNIRIENTSSNEVYIVGFNVFKLDEYDGEGIDSFVAVGSTLHPFISNTGASDYAMMNDETGSNFGSYHGGEKSNRCDVLWRDGNANGASYRAFSSLDAGDFTVTEFLALKQITILIERAYMHSNMNFNTDGTLQMDFSYQMFANETNIPFRDFWTALTCTDPNFTILRQPVYQTAGSSTGHRFFKSTDGYVIQETNSGLQELHSRFTRFNNEFIGTSEASSVSYQAGYNKHYYAPIRNYRNDSRPIAPDTLQFSKGLDFYVY